MNKECSNCGELKPHKDYQKRALSLDGLTASCKACLHARDAKRFQEDPRVKERHARYAATPAGLRSISRSKAKWLSNNSDKRAAYVILGNAVRGGRKDKPDSCSICGCKHYRIHGHHEDYTKPLDVIWCCPQCHADIHRLHSSTNNTRP